jgi:peptidoglycan/xylan/chitin deacetylase (PgdA/CDA1 family)
MQSSDDLSRASLPKRLPRRILRFFTIHPGGRIFSLLLLVSVVGWGWWYNEHRVLSWRETLNPVYWWHRWRGEDFYIADQALLMHGSHNLAEVALTFDDGPHAASRGQILDTLRQFHVHATFFDVGKNMERNPDLVRRTLAEGNEIANHSTNHQRLDGLGSMERHHEINDADITYYRITGQHLKLLRPPGMRYNSSVLADARELGYVVVGYTTASKDFNPKETSEFIAQRTLDRTENGSIILLHDYPTTAAALPAILKELQARGYRCVTVSELIAHLPAQARLPAERLLQEP